jgi:hypothetical protein
VVRPSQRGLLKPEPHIPALWVRPPEHATCSKNPRPPSMKGIAVPTERHLGAPVSPPPPQGRRPTTSVCVVSFGVPCALVLQMMSIDACGGVKELELTIRRKDGAGRSTQNVERDWSPPAQDLTSELNPTSIC